MAENKNSPAIIKIVGLITSYAFQEAKFYAEKLHKCHPRRFGKPTYREMLEFDWSQYITKQRRKLGGKLWIAEDPLIIYFKHQVLVSVAEFQDIVEHEYRFSIPIIYLPHFECAKEDYIRYLNKTKRIYVYLDITIGNKYVGSMLFQLYSDLLPDTCKNFKCLCTGERGVTKKGIDLYYKGTHIHRSAKNGWIQGGDVEKKIGGGGVSVFGDTFPDESLCVKHDRRGVLSMVNSGKHSNASQFFITLQPCSWMDYYYVAFGQLIEGNDVLCTIETMKTVYESPVETIYISNCGQLLTSDDRQIDRRLGIEEPVIDHIFETYKVEQNVHPKEVPDIRDVPSFVTEERFLAGLYSYTKPRVIRRPSQETTASVAVEEFIFRLLGDVIPLPGKEYETKAEVEAFARFMAGEIVRKAISVDQYENRGDITSFIKQVVFQIVSQSMGDDMIETRSDVCDFAEFLVREMIKTATSSETEDAVDKGNFVKIIAEEIIRRATPTNATSTEDMINAMIYSSMTEALDRLFPLRTDVRVIAESIVDNVIAMAQEIIGISMELLDSVELQLEYLQKKGIAMSSSKFRDIMEGVLVDELPANSRRFSALLEEAMEKKALDLNSKFYVEKTVVKLFESIDLKKVEEVASRGETSVRSTSLITVVSPEISNAEIESFEGYGFTGSEDSNE